LLILTFEHLPFFPRDGTDFCLLLADLGMARTTPLPDRHTLDTILDKLQKCVSHNLYMLIMPSGHWFML
jgi:hypothetical protein